MAQGAAFASPPEIVIFLTGQEVRENAPKGTVVGLLSTTDPEGSGSYSFALLDDGAFAIDGDKLVVAGAIDFEAAPYRQIEVIASDGFAGLTETFVIAVDNVAGNAVRGSDRAETIAPVRSPKAEQGPTAEEDRIKAGGGDDTIVAGGGDDIVFAGAGDDRIVGGSGRDWLAGNKGADVFVFKRLSDSAVDRPDRIVGFKSGEGDKIDLRGIDADLATAADDKFKFIGSGEFSYRARELRFDAAQKLLQGDVDGDGVADFAIHLGVAALLKADLLL